MDCTLSIYKLIAQKAWKFIKKISWKFDVIKHLKHARRISC